MKALLVVLGRSINKTISELHSITFNKVLEQDLFIYANNCENKRRLIVPKSIKKGWCVERGDYPLINELRKTLLEIIAREGYRIVLFDDSLLSFWIAPMIAGEFRASIITDVIDIKREENNLVFTRPIQKEKVWADYCSNSEKTFLIIRKGYSVIESEKHDIILESIELVPDGSIGYISVRKGEESKLEEAEVVIGLGDGVALSETISLAMELAKLINAEYAGTKPLVEKSLLPRERLVGLSGKRITPRLYIAMGISGSMYHVSGVISSGTVISINKDPYAQMNLFSDYYFIGDLRNVLPTLIEKLREKKTNEP